MVRSGYSVIALICKVCIFGDVFFFFQAEDGIRDLTVTGVQTCALPISGRPGCLPAKVLSCRTAPCAYVPKLITEGSPACPRSPAAGYPRALQPAAREQMPASATQPGTGQVAGQMANTLRNSRVRPPRLCYLYCMISPIRGDRTGFRVQ